MRILIVTLMASLFTGSSYGGTNVKTEAIEYRQGDAVLEGFLAYDQSKEGRRPGILVIHEWRGLDDYAKSRARQLAEMGYVAFALDMYGKGVVAKDAQEAMKLASPFYADRQLMRDRAAAGLEVLKRQKLTDVNRLAVIGFCFGGTTALELAMSGAILRGVVSFHGGLSFPNTEGVKNIHGTVAILHGGKDPHVPQNDVVSFWNALERAGVDYRIDVFGGAVHSFTNPASGNNDSTGVAYNERAERRAWREMQALFAEIF